MITEQEMKRFLSIIECADGGCSYCVNDLYEMALVEFPDFKELINKKWQEWKKGKKEVLI